MRCRGLVNRVQPAVGGDLFEAVPSTVLAGTFQLLDVQELQREEVEAKLLAERLRWNGDKKSTGQDLDGTSEVTYCFSRRQALRGRARPFRLVGVLFAKAQRRRPPTSIRFRSPRCDRQL